MCGVSSWLDIPLFFIFGGERFDVMFVDPPYGAGVSSLELT